MSETKKKSQKRVVLFTSSTCHWCNVAKNHFQKHKIRFKQVDITKDKKAALDCANHGCKGVPVVLIGSRWICGFDQKKIDKILGI
jgi:glutaredoxin